MVKEFTGISKRIVFILGMDVKYKISTKISMNGKR